VLIKTLTEEIESQRKENESAATVEEEDKRGSVADATVMDREGSGGGWSFEGLVKMFTTRS
jgi:hypothetical protein